jgi:hypothetical protein
MRIAEASFPVFFRTALATAAALAAFAGLNFLLCLLAKLAADQGIIY